MSYICNMHIYIYIYIYMHTYLLTFFISLLINQKSQIYKNVKRSVNSPFSHKW